MILVAPRPKMEIKSGDRVFVSDHRQIIYDVSGDYVGGLISEGCSPVPPVIVMHAFPTPLSIHCFACGEFIESGDEDPWYWRWKGEVRGFMQDHFYHAAANYVGGWPQYPVTHETKVMAGRFTSDIMENSKPRIRVKAVMRKIA